jgi:hypothetical protein
MNTKKPAQAAIDANEDLEEGEKVLRAEKRRAIAMATGSKLERENAKRTVKTIEKGVELAEERRENLEQLKDDRSPSSRQE